MTAIAVFIMTNSFSQEREAGTFELAPYIGYASSFFNGDDASDFDPINGVNFGIKFDYYFNDRWSLRSGISMDPMGAKEKFSGTKIKLNYVHIPLNANWHFGSTRKWNLNFGVSPGFLTKADVLGEDIKDIVEPFQLAITYGIGYRIEISENFGILIDTQGIFGLSNIIKDSEGETNLNAGSSINVGGVFAF